MNEWKQAFSLTKLEIKTSFVNIILCWGIMTFLSLIFFTGLKGYMENNDFAFDLFFLFGLSFAPFFFRSKQYQYQKCADQLYASPTLIMMNQLPIPREVLAKSRLLITYIYILPYLLSLFAVSYVLVPGVREVMDLSTYIAFFIITLFLVLIIGMMYPASDPGDKVTMFKMAAYFVVGFLGMFIISSFFHLYHGYGIVAWLIYLANHWALISIFFLIVLFFVSLKFWPSQMTRTMKKLDYP